MPNTRFQNLFRRMARIVLLVMGLLAGAYLGLVWAGGGWGPRHDERFDWDDRRVLLFAHRGVAVEGPENSEASFDTAQRLGFSGIELDVRRTRDNQLALSHDPSALRMLGINRNFSELTLAEIKGHRLLFRGRETTYHAPTLQEVFKKYGHTFRFYLDMKNKSFRDADLLARVIQEYGVEERSLVASVDPLFVAYMEHHYPRINTALERFDAAQVWLYRLTPKRWKPDFLSGSSQKASSAHVAWLGRNGLLSQRIVYDVDGRNFARVMRLGITKAVADYAPGAYSPALSPPALPTAAGPASADP
jgi:glycerophosphoryl diester phosphodiesterase